jgi:hypothetical protein
LNTSKWAVHKPVDVRSIGKVLGSKYGGLMSYGENLSNFFHAQNGGA